MMIAALLRNADRVPAGLALSSSPAAPTSDAVTFRSIQSVSDQVSGLNGPRPCIVYLECDLGHGLESNTNSIADRRRIRSERGAG